MSQRAHQTLPSLPEEPTPSSLTVWTVTATPGLTDRHPELDGSGSEYLAGSHYLAGSFALADGSEFAYGDPAFTDDSRDFAGDELTDERTELVEDAELIDCSTEQGLTEDAHLQDSTLSLSVEVWPWDGTELVVRHGEHPEQEPPESYVRELKPVQWVASIEQAARRIAPVIRYAALEEASPVPASSPVSTVRRVLHPALDPATPLEDPPVGRPPQISLLLWLRLAATCSWI